MGASLAHDEEVAKTVKVLVLLLSVMYKQDMKNLVSEGLQSFNCSVFMLNGKQY